MGTSVSSGGAASLDDAASESISPTSSNSDSSTMRVFMLSSKDGMASRILRLFLALMFKFWAICSTYVLILLLTFWFYDSIVCLILLHVAVLGESELNN